MRTLLTTITVTVTVALALLGASPAHAQNCQNGPAWEMPAGTSLFCSASWAFTGVCNGVDMVYAWAAAGTNQGQGNAAHPGAWHIPPWEPAQITVRGVELSVTGGPTPTWLMAGNGYVPDAMLFVVSERHGRHDFPAGTGMPVPPTADAAHQYFDLHGSCPAGGGTIVVIYTLYYTTP
jgi:hypothetical protein